MSKITITVTDRRTEEYEVVPEVAEAICHLVQSINTIAPSFRLTGTELKKQGRNQHRKPKDYEELKEYALSKGALESDAYAFFAQMESNGWTLRDGNAVKNWKAHFAHYQAEGWLMSQKKH